MLAAKDFGPTDVAEAAAALGVGEQVTAQDTVPYCLFIASHYRKRFEAAMSARPEVTQLYSTTGEADYILKVVVSDIQAYEAFLKQHLFRLPAVVNVRSSVVLSELKNDTALPLDAMA